VEQTFNTLFAWEENVGDSIIMDCATFQLTICEVCDALIMMGVVWLTHESVSYAFLLRGFSGHLCLKRNQRRNSVTPSSRLSSSRRLRLSLAAPVCRLIPPVTTSSRVYLFRLPDNLIFHSFSLPVARPPVCHPSP
jgi:hypothetical protein